MKDGNNAVPAGRDGYTWFRPQNIEIQHLFNPRTRSNPGFGLEKMRALRENIRTDGLKTPLEVWVSDGKPKLIAGERRLRAILGLIDDNEPVYNVNSGEMEPASKVYEQVCVKVTPCADAQAARRAAVMENALHEHLTDYEVLLYCQDMENVGISRADQAKKFGKSEAWISQSHSLLDPERCHPRVLESLADGTLGRTQALHMLNVIAELKRQGGLDRVEAVLDRAIAYNREELAEREKELLTQRDTVYENLEIEQAKLAVAQAMDDEDGAADARRSVAEIEREAESTERKIKKLKAGGDRNPHPSINNIQDAARDEQADGGINRHMPMKTVKQMADKLTKVLENQGEIVNTATGEPYSRREVRIVRDVLDCVLSRNKMKNPLDALGVVDEPVAEVEAEEEAEAAK